MSYSPADEDPDDTLAVVGPATIALVAEIDRIRRWHRRRVMLRRVAWCVLAVLPLVALAWTSR